MEELRRFRLKNVSEKEKRNNNLRDFLMIGYSPVEIHNYNDNKNYLCYIDYCDGGMHSKVEIDNYYEEFDIECKFTIIENDDANNINRLLLALHKNRMLGGNGYDNYIGIQLLTDFPKSMWQPIADMAFDSKLIEYQDNNTRTSAKINIKGVRYLENNNLID